MVLTLGSKGEDVKKLQERLNKLGYIYLDPDGFFGNKTAINVKKYQQEAKQIVSGIVTDFTWNSLFTDKKISPQQDKISIERIKTMHPRLRGELRKIFDEANEVLTGKALLRFAYTLRTFAEQDALYAQGRTAKGAKVTNAKGGQSYHNYGLACDIVLIKDNNGDGMFETASWETTIDFDGDNKADWMEVKDIFTKYGWAWGGDWKFTDKPHFEKTFGYSTSQLYQKKISNQVDSLGYVLL